MSESQQQTDPRGVPHYEPPGSERPASAAPTEGQLEAETPGGHAAGRHDPYVALRSPGYRAYCLGWVVSVIGRQIQDVAVGYEIYERTNSKMAIAYIGLAQAIPGILLALPAGHVADRFDRRLVIVVTQALWAAASLALAVVSHRQGPVPLMYALLALGGAAHAAGWPARSSILPQIVPPHAFNNAVTWNSSFFQVAAMLGPALGGLILLRGAAPAYLVDAACGLAFAGLIWAVRVRPAARSREPATFQTLVAGFRFVWRTKIILATLTLDLFAVLFGGSVYLLPVFRKDVLQISEVAFGWLRAAPALGAFAAAMLIAHSPPMQRAGRNMLWAVAGFGLATIVFGLSRSFWLSFLMLALTGAFDNVSVVVRHTLVQALPPDSMRGRVAAVNAVFIGASNEIGGIESGLTAAWWGPVAAVVFGGAMTIVVVLAVATIWPQVRAFGSLRDAKPVEEDGSEGSEILPAKPA